MGSKYNNSCTKRPFGTPRNCLFHLPIKRSNGTCVGMPVLLPASGHSNSYSKKSLIPYESIVMGCKNKKDPEENCKNAKKLQVNQVPTAL